MPGHTDSGLQTAALSPECCFSAAEGMKRVNIWQKGGEKIYVLRFRWKTSPDRESGMLMKHGNKRNLLKKITKTASLNVRVRCQNQASAPEERPSDPPASVFQTTQWRRNLEVVFLARPWSPWRAAGQSPSATFGLASESLPWRAATAPLGWFTVKSWPSWIVTPAPGSSSTPCTRRPGPASRSPLPTCCLCRRATAQRGRSHLKAPSRLFMPVTPTRDSVCWSHRATARRSSLRSPGSQ